jgi:hypothetical protein
MEFAYDLTRHARDRSTERTIPPFVADAIITYGRSMEAGDGARKYALTKDSMRELRRIAGHSITKILGTYRSRNAYVVVAGSRIITVAFASRPLFR